MLNYHRHLKHAAKNQKPLNELLKDRKKNDKRSVSWNVETIAAFEACKAHKCYSTAHPLKGATILLFTDASNTAIGASLEQASNKRLSLIAFFSKKTL